MTKQQFLHYCLNTYMDVTVKMLADRKGGSGKEYKRQLTELTNAVNARLGQA